MGTKFLLSVFGILGYMAAWAVVLIIITFFEGGLSDETLGVILVILGALIFILYLPYFIWLTQKVWFFPSSAKPSVPFEKLKEDILSINTYDAPVMVTEKDPKHLLITWKYVDAKWWEIFRKAGLTSIYRLHVKFVPEKHEVHLTDVTSSVNWGAGPAGVSYRWTFFRGILMGVSIGKAWGIKENLSLGKIYDYRFDPMEIKNPVLNTILKSGWNVRFTLF